MVGHYSIFVLVTRSYLDTKIAWAIYNGHQLVCVAENYENRDTPIKSRLVIIAIDTANVQTKQLEAKGPRVSYEC